MKKFIKTFSTLLLLVPCPVYAEQTADAQQQVTASGFADILVSFLYLALVLALIYVILLLIERNAKKHSQSPEQNDKDTQTNAADELKIVTEETESDSKDKENHE